MCDFPKLVRNPKYRVNKKNGGEVPKLPLRNFNGNLVPDSRVTQVPIACGNCYSCKKAKAREWKIRLNEEIKHNPHAVFITLTFSDESISHINKLIHPSYKGYERDNAIAAKAVRLFTERWRKKFKKQPRRWLVTELGHKGTENLHFHGLIWLNPKSKIGTTEYKKEMYQLSQDIRTIWKYGFVWLSTENNGWVNWMTITYITKYILKADPKHPNYKGKVFCSNGIGKAFINSPQFKQLKFASENTKEYYRTETGHKLALPLYYRNHLYNDEEKEKLWIQKLEKGIVYVDGNPINLNRPNGPEVYEKALLSAQNKSNSMGFVGTKKDKEQMDHESMIRQQRLWVREMRAAKRASKKK